MVTLSLSDSVTVLAGQCHYADGIVTPSPNVLFLRFSIGKIEAKYLKQEKNGLLICKNMRKAEAVMQEKWLYMQLLPTKQVDFLLKEGGFGFKGRSVWFKTNLSLLIKQC